VRTSRSTSPTEELQKKSCAYVSIQAKATLKATQKRHAKRASNDTQVQCGVAVMVAAMAAISTSAVIKRLMTKFRNTCRGGRGQGGALCTSSTPTLFAQAHEDMSKSQRALANPSAESTPAAVVASVAMRSRRANAS
jgi:hypothetical protein